MNEGTDDFGRLCPLCFGLFQRQLSMRKFLFFFLYLGDEQASIKDVVFRLALVDQELTHIQNRLAASNLQFEKMYVIPVCPTRYDTILHELIQTYGYTIYQDQIVRENLFEYPAFVAMQQAAEQNPDALFFYTHSKGTGHYHPLSYEIFHRHMTRLLVENIEDYFKDPSIKKVGLFPSEKGWIWHNFFWIKAQYLLSKNALIKDDNRFYYESYIGNKDGPVAYTECLSLLKGDPSIKFEALDFYAPESINSYIHQI